jgi:hypothetical protein
MTINADLVFNIFSPVTTFIKCSSVFLLASLEMRRNESPDEAKYLHPCRFMSEHEMEPPGELAIQFDANSQLKYTFGADSIELLG